MYDFNLLVNNSSQWIKRSDDEVYTDIPKVLSTDSLTHKSNMIKLL